MPRNQGLITIAEMKPDPTSSRHPRDGDSGFVCCLAGDPFLEVIFEEAHIRLLAGLPACLATWIEHKRVWMQRDTAITPPPTKLKDYRTFVSLCRRKKVGHGEEAKIDLYQADAVQRAEFLVQTIVSRMKYSVSNKRHAGLVPKADLDLTGLLELATKDYDRKCR